MIKRILLLGALALGMGTAVRIATAPAPAVATSSQPAEQAEPRGDGRPRWEPVWTKPAPALSAMALSEDGGTIAWVDTKGSIRRMDARGRTLQQTEPLRGINRLVASSSGAVLAYSWLNPARPSVTLLSSKAGTPVTYPVEGAVWDVAVTGSGAQAVVGTGERFVYVLPTAVEKGAAPKPLQQWRTPGIPECVATTPAEPLVVLGTWQDPDAGVSAWALDGTPRWRHNETDPARQYQVTLSADGTTAVGVSAKGPREGEAALHVWDTDTGRELWKQDLDGFHPGVLITQQGRFIAVTYVKFLRYGTGDVVERKVALFDRSGKRLWERGGLYFSPELVALAANGTRLTVTDGVNRLYTLDAKGNIVSQMRLPVNPGTGVPPTIRETVATEDGKHLLVRRGDGQITLLKATL